MCIVCVCEVCGGRERLCAMCVYVCVGGEGLCALCVYVRCVGGRGVVCIVCVCEVCGGERGCVHCVCL